MAPLTTAQYDALERAIVDRRRIAVWRRGTEYIVIPQRLAIVRGKETLEAMHPTTGHPLSVILDETDRIEVIRG
ncbi:MAG: hypothetical protein K2X99_09665 [Gemmatimonadaceae bacterium]|nr:hypothetical protein [Gemmatimonadaceae bacterium]